MNESKVFLFEYATCGETLDDIAVEGAGMFKVLYDGFREIGISVNSFVGQEFADYFPLPIAKNWIEDFEIYAENSNFALIIAPEIDFLLFKLTKIVERKTENLGSTSKGILIASDKWLSYLAIKGKVNAPKTSLKSLNVPFVIKPRLSCGGEGISYGTDVDVPEGYIAQEFVKGIDVSVSLLVGDEIRVLSINRQLINNFRYKGAVVPFDCEKEVVEEAIKAIEAIDGLFGYVGVDLVVADIPYVVEVNPRITTPCVLFREVYGVNLADVLIRNYEGKRIPEFKANKKLLLEKIKKKDVVKAREIISFKDHSLVAHMG